MRSIKLLAFGILLFISALSVELIFAQNKPLAAQLALIKLPPEFEINIYAQNPSGLSLEDARMMAIGPDKNLYVSLPKQNKVIMLTAVNTGEYASKAVVVADKGLNSPHGLAFVQGKLYVANEDSVVRLEQDKFAWPAVKVSPIITGLATGGHRLKSLKVGPDQHFYLNVGSSCNVCLEEDPSRATILRYSLEGKPSGALLTLGRHAQSAVWARGLRNSQGFAWHPVTGAMFATNEGADNRSQSKDGHVNDELPPEHLNLIEAGKHYGWPHCWGNQVTDPNFLGAPNFCASTQWPSITFDSHSTPIGITFLHQADVPEDYKQDAIVALHGSWNRAQPSGYKLVRVKFTHNMPSQVEDFATGWLQAGKAWGRPVDVIVGDDGAIYVSDDKLGVIYRISRKKSGGI